MATRAKTGGRQKGTPNKLTTLARDAIQAAFDDLGGTKGLVKWVEENNGDMKRIFYTQIWPKILPLQGKTAGCENDSDPIEEVRITIHDSQHRSDQGL